MTGDLFGVPTYDGALGQFHTPPWLADRLAGMLAFAGVRERPVFEPCAGGGALVAAALRVGFKHIVAMEIDKRWEQPFWTVVAQYSNPARDSVELHVGNSLNKALARTVLGEDGFVALSNPPYDDGIDADHMERDLEVCGSGVALLRTVALHGGDRFARFWRHVEITALEFYVDRVAFDGNTGKIDVCGVAWRRRTQDATDRPTVLHVRGPGR